VFARLGRWCFHHRIVVVVVWLVLLVGGGAVAGYVGTGFRSEFSLPDVESRQGFEIVDEYFGGVGGGQAGSIVFKAEQGVTDPEVQAAMTEFLAAVDQLPDVNVGSPFQPGGEQQISRLGESAGLVAFATVDVPRDTSLEDAQELASEIRDLQPAIPGLQIELGGQIFAEFEPPTSEVLGLAFAIIVLILSFGSVLAMGLPIGLALAGIGVGTILTGLLSNVVTMPDFTSTLGIMIGLGVGIDYALFIVTRYREHLHRGESIERSTVVAIDTAGRAVIFAGTTVVISLLGMLVMGVSFVQGLAIGAAVVVAVTMVASVTLLPALLGFVGERVEVTRWRGLIAAGLVAIALVGVGLRIDPLLLGLPLAVVVLAAGFVVAPLKREVPRRPPKPMRETLPYKWSRLIQRRPWPAAILGAGLLVLLAVPFFSLRLGFSDEGNFPEDSTTRKAYDLLAEGFGPGFNGPLLLASRLPNGAADLPAAQQVAEALAGTPGVAFASPAIPNDPANPEAVIWRLIPTTSPQEEATTQLVSDLRSEVLPAATEGTSLDVAVSGSVAANVDFTEYLGARLPYFFGVVLALSFLLLMVVFRSLLVPLKAVIMNLLSIAAAYGVVVAIFQWGWFGSVFGVEPAPIEPFVPMMLFAIVFGLSMDYEVFLLSRIREEWLRTGNSRESVADGLAATARVITAAAAIMVVVFGAFLLENDRVIKLFGVGLATAVFLDATIVRMLLVPATMELLGDRNWWLPRWLDKILPHVDVEGPVDDLDLGLEGTEEPKEPALR
jgi:putative drug exporter of the RND superfamily